MVWKRILIGICGIAAVWAGLTVWNTNAQDAPQPELSRPAPIPTLTPEIIEQINARFEGTKVLVPLAEMKYTPTPDVDSFLGITYDTQWGKFRSGGNLIIGFERATFKRGDLRHIEVTLGKPIFIALDDSFETNDLDSRVLGAHDPFFVDKARATLRTALRKQACNDGTYEKASMVGVQELRKTILSILPDAQVVTHTTAEAEC